MSMADKYFKETCKDILENGTNTIGEKVRPHWEDGSPAYTLKQFGVVNRYDLRREFPAITLRRIALKSAMDEILWIYQKKSNNIHDLNSHIWDSWADKTGSIGKAYGYQIGVKNRVKGISVEGLENAFGKLEEFVIDHGDWKEFCYISKATLDRFNELMKEGKTTDAQIYVFEHSRAIVQKDLYSNEVDILMDQMDKVIYDLKNTPFSRRIMTCMWNPGEAVDMHLEPCAYSMTYNVTEENGQLVLNGILNQRSQDMLAANGWNIAQYAILLMMVAQTVGMVPGRLIHVIADAHIYDRHVPMIKELLEREEYPAPKVSLSEGPKSFYDFTTDDLIVTDYQYGEQIKNIPVAV